MTKTDTCWYCEHTLYEEAYEINSLERKITYHCGFEPSIVAKQVEREGEKMNLTDYKIRIHLVIHISTPNLSIIGVACGCCQKDASKRVKRRIECYKCKKLLWEGYPWKKRPPLTLRKIDGKDRYTCKESCSENALVCYFCKNSFKEGENCYFFICEGGEEEKMCIRCFRPREKSMRQWLSGHSIINNADPRPIIHLSVSLKKFLIYQRTKPFYHLRPRPFWLLYIGFTFLVVGIVGKTLAWWWKGFKSYEPK